MPLDNASKIQALKDRLNSGGLTQKQIDNLIKEIQGLGGKANAANFPAAGQAPGGQPTGGGTTASGNDIAALKAKLANGGLSQSQYDNILAKIKAAGGAVNTANFPNVGETPADYKKRTGHDPGPGSSKDPATGDGTGGKGGKKKVDLNQEFADAITRTDELLKKGEDYAKHLQETYLPDGSFVTVPEGSSKEMLDMLAKMNEWSKTAGNLSPAEQDSLNKLKSGTVTAPEMQEALNNLKAFRDRAGDLTDLEKESLDLMRQGLAGYDAPEVQAMRESASQEISRQYAGQFKQLQQQQARQGTRGGGAAFAQSQDIMAQKRGELGNLERDLVIKNADEVQRRRESFADLASKTDAARFNRQSTTQELYNRSMSTEQERLNNARASYGVQATSTAQNAFNRAASAKTLYATSLSGEEAAQRNLKMFNAGQMTNEQLAQAGMITGGIGAYAGTVSGEEAAGVGTKEFNLLLKQQRNYIKKMMEEARKAREDNNKNYQDYLDSLG